MQKIQDAINWIFELEKSSTGQVHPSNDLVLNLLVEENPIEKIKAHFYDENESSKMKRGSKDYVKSLLDLAKLRADTLLKFHEEDEGKTKALNECKIKISNLITELNTN